MLLLLSPVLACDEILGADLYPSSQASLPPGAVVLIGHPEPEYEIINSEQEVEELELGRWTGLVMDLPEGDYFIAFQGVERLITLDGSVVPGPFAGQVSLSSSEVRLEDFDENGCEDGQYVWVDASLALPAVDGFGWSARIRDTVSGRSFGYVELAPFVDVERQTSLVLPYGEADRACLRVTVYDPFLEEAQDFELDCVELPLPDTNCGCGGGSEAPLLLALLSLVPVIRRRIRRASPAPPPPG